MQSQVHGGDIYSAEYSNDFSISTSPLGMPDGVRKAYIESVNTLSQYPDVRCRELRASPRVSSQRQAQISASRTPLTSQRRHSPHTVIRMI